MAFKVLIAGGSVAGLTLALVLQSVNIEFEVLEKGDFATQLGATIGIQLGVWDEIEPKAIPLRHRRFYDADMKLWDQDGVTGKISDLYVTHPRASRPPPPPWGRCILERFSLQQLLTRHCPVRDTKSFSLKDASSCGLCTHTSETNPGCMPAQSCPHMWKASPASRSRLLKARPSKGASSSGPMVCTARPGIWWLKSFSRRTRNSAKLFRNVGFKPPPLCCQLIPSSLEYP